MKNVLRKRLPRFFKRNLGSYLGMAVFITLAVCICTAYITANESTRSAYDFMVDEYHQEDGNFSLGVKAELDTLASDLPSCLELEYQPYADLDLDEDTEVRLFAMRKNINLPYVLDGNLPSTENEIAIDTLFADAQSLHIGSTMDLEGRTLKVSGIIGLPDYAISFKSLGDLLADRKVFGVGVVTDECFSMIDEQDLNHQYSYKYKSELNDDEINRMSRSIISTLGEKYCLTDHCVIGDNTRLNSINSKIDLNINVSTYFVILSMIMIAFLFSLVSAHTFEEECSFVGVLIATGYKKGTILRHYLTIPFLVTLFSSVIGFILGITVMYEVPAESIYEYYTLPDMRFTLNSTLFILMLIVPAVTVLLINFLVFRRKLNIAPLKLIRKDIKKESKLKNAREMKNLGFLNRFRIRTFSRSKGKYVSLVLGVFLAGWLIMFGLGMSSSFDIYIDNLPDSAASDYEYILKAPLSDDSMVSSDVERNTLSSYEIPFKGRMLTVNVLGISSGSKYFSDIDVSNLAEDEIIISNIMADKIGIHTGDVITIDNKLTLHKWEAKVVKIVDFKVGVYAFTSQEMLNTFLGKEPSYYNSLFSDNAIPDIDMHYVVSEVTREKIADSARQMKTLCASLIVILTIVGVVCYVIVMYLLTKLLIDKNALNISLLKVFGYRNKEVNKLYLTGNEVIIILSVILFLPVQYFLMDKMWPSMLASMTGYFYFKVNITVIAAIILLATATCILTNIFHVKRVRKIAMTEALKNRE